MTTLKHWFAYFRGEVEDLASDLLETDLAATADKIVRDADRLITRVEQEKTALKEEIDALTRQITEKDRAIELARTRAQKAYELAHKVREGLGG